MHKVLYFLRVLIVSVEFVILLLLAYLYLKSPNETLAFAYSIHLNEDFYKYVTLLPLAIFIWSLKHTYAMVFEEADATRFLVNWNYYWKLKTHNHVSLIYSTIFCVLCTSIWALDSNGANELLIYFALSMVGSLVTALSIYLAQMRLKEIQSSAIAV